jgi:hypothetical protein
LKLLHPCIAARHVDVQFKNGRGSGLEANAHGMEAVEDFVGGGHWFDYPLRRGHCLLDGLAAC